MNKTQRIVFVSLIILATVSIFASDSYLPSLPAITASLDTSHRMVRLTVSLYLFGFGVAPLFFGPLFDRFGRKKIMIYGLSIALIGSVISALAPNIGILIMGRFIQGFGVGGGFNGIRVVTSDVFDKRGLVRTASITGAILGIMPMIAPIIGGYIQHYLGWRENFILLLILIFLAFLWVTLIQPETIKAIDAAALRPKKIFNNYWRLLKDKNYLAFPLAASIAYSMIIVYITVSPYLFQGLLGFNAVQYGWLGMVAGSALAIGSLINGRLNKYFLAQNILITAAILFILASLAMLGFGLAGILNAWVILIPIFIIATSLQLVFPNLYAECVSRLSDSTGIAVALYSTIQFVISSICSGLASASHINNQIPLALWLVVLSVIFIGILFFTKEIYREKSENETHSSTV